MNETRGRHGPTENIIHNMQRHHSQSHLQFGAHSLAHQAHVTWLRGLCWRGHSAHHPPFVGPHPSTWPPPHRFTCTCSPSFLSPPNHVPPRHPPSVTTPCFDVLPELLLWAVHRTHAHPPDWLMGFHVTFVTHSLISSLEECMPTAQSLLSFSVLLC